MSKVEGRECSNVARGAAGDDHAGGLFGINEAVVPSDPPVPLLPTHRTARCHEATGTGGEWLRGKQMS